MKRRRSPRFEMLFMKLNIPVFHNNQGENVRLPARGADCDRLVLSSTPAISLQPTEHQLTEI